MNTPHRQGFNVCIGTANKRVFFCPEPNFLRSNNPIYEQICFEVGQDVTLSLCNDKEFADITSTVYIINDYEYNTSH